MSLTATFEQARQIVLFQLQQLWASPAQARHISPLMLWSAPGVGKSTLIRSVCESMGIGFIDIRLSQREPVDLRGLPTPDGDQVRWLLSSEWPRDPLSRGIILFDELTSCDRSLQVAAYELILDRRLGDLYRVPDGWLLCGAGNRVEDRAVATPMSSALANRFCHLEMIPDVEQWTRFAHGQGLHPDVIAFLRFQPQHLLCIDHNTERGYPTPRSWQRVSTFLGHAVAVSGQGKAASLDDACLRLTIHGLVGQAAGTEFLAFREWTRKLPDIPALLRGEVPVSIPSRADLQVALCASVAHHLWHGPEHELPRRLQGFFTVSHELASDMATLLLIDALQGRDEVERETRMQLLFSHPEFENWLTKHGLPMEQIEPISDPALPEMTLTLDQAKKMAQHNQGMPQ